VSTTLQEVAAVADEVAEDQRQIARKARTMQRQRDRGLPWSTVLNGESVPIVLQLLRRSTRRLTEVAGGFARTIADGLSHEGYSRRQIARRLGVSHQRVSALMNGRRRSDDSPSAPAEEPGP
jgi:transcriptional regulator with XRE-family HTH domain